MQVYSGFPKFQIINYFPSPRFDRTGNVSVVENNINNDTTQLIHFDDQRLFYLNKNVLFIK